MSQQWRGPQDGRRGGRFSDERKPLVERPPMIAEPNTCWCGEQHDKQGRNPKYWSAGIHPWPALEEEEE